MLYEIQFRLPPRNCCSKRVPEPQIVKIEANSVEEAKVLLRKKVPSARFDYVREVIE